MTEMACEVVRVKEELNVSEPEAEVFENYGVFQNDYEFKFVQEGTDKTTLMLPTVTYNSMDVQYFNIEIEVDNALLVENIQAENTERNTVRYSLKIAKHGLFHAASTDFEPITEAQTLEQVIQAVEKRATAPNDVHNYSKNKEVNNPPAKENDQVSDVVQIVSESRPVDTSTGTVLMKPKVEALDGTEISNDLADDPDYILMDDDGDDDDDLGDLDDSDFSPSQASSRSSRSGAGGTPKSASKKERKTSRKYEKTSHYSGKVDSTEQFTVQKNEAGDKWFDCNNCQYTSKWVGNMRDHVRIHTGERPFVCNVCNKGFTNQSAYNNHSKIHSDTRPHVCKICGFAFKVRRQLMKHEERHKGGGQFKCQHCGRQYFTKTELRNHMPVHTKERAHKCEVCFKTFTSVSSLSRHRMIHTGGTYQCHLCGGVFMRKEYWRKHMIRSHDYAENDALLSKRIRYTSMGTINDGQAELVNVGDERQEVIKVGAAVETEDVGTSMEVTGEEEGEVQYIISLAY